MPNPQLYDLTPDGENFLRELLFRDWSRVFTSLVSQGFTVETTWTIIFKLSCFLTLTCVYPDALIPSQQVDHALHLFMEDSVQYKRQLQTLNHSVDHVPYLGNQNTKRQRQFQATQKLFFDIYGIPLIAEGEEPKMGGCHLQKAQGNSYSSC